MFKITQAPHPYLTRKGNHLHTKQKISLKESILGFKRSIRHLDGRRIEIETGSGELTQHGARFAVEGEGMLDRKTGQYGDLIVTIEVVWPKTKVQGEARNLIEQGFNKMGGRTEL